MCLKSGACCKYLTSISWVSHKLSQASIYWFELSVWVTPQTERVIVLSKILALNKSPALLLSVISRQHGNNNRTINYRSGIGCHKAKGCVTSGRAISEHGAYDVYLKCVLLANIKRLCWILQVVEWGDVLVYRNNGLRCLHPIAYKARYVQKCRVMRFMRFMISITKNPILYSL